MTIEQEMQQAFEKYGHFHSTHEVYGVLKEEVDEFWELVKMPKELKESHEEIAMDMRRELTQIAAVALRAAKELEENKIKFV